MGCSWADASEPKETAERIVYSALQHIMGIQNQANVVVKSGALQAPRKLNPSHRV